VTRNQMCKNIIEAIGANFRGTKLHYYSNAGVTNTGQELLKCWGDQYWSRTIISKLHVTRNKIWPSGFVAGRKWKARENWKEFS